MMSVPAPFTHAPMLPRKLARSTMCGSLAALCMVVAPSANTAASMALIVAPTLGMSRWMSAPCMCSPVTVSTPRCVFTSAPSAVQALTV